MAKRLVSFHQAEMGCLVTPKRLPAVPQYRRPIAVAHVLRLVPRYRGFLIVQQPYSASPLFYVEESSLALSASKTTSSAAIGI